MFAPKPCHKCGIELTYRSLGGQLKCDSCNLLCDVPGCDRTASLFSPEGDLCPEHRPPGDPYPSPEAVRNVIAG